MSNSSSPRVFPFVNIESVTLITSYMRLMLIPDSHPEQAKKSEYRRTVRSHATRSQHQKDQREQQERAAAVHRPNIISQSFGPLLMRSSIARSLANPDFDQRSPKQLLRHPTRIITPSNVPGFDDVELILHQHGNIALDYCKYSQLY